MKRIITLILGLLVLQNLSFASHVVGGDFHIQMVSQVAGGANYHIKLRAYRDDVNGIAMPSSVTIGVYQVGTHTQVATQTLTQTSLGLVPLGDPCYTPDPNVVRIEEGIFESPSNLFLPDYGPGYYISGKINARNSLAVNVQSGGTMTWFAMIPDPALGQNSSPDFGNYPNDAYFCVNSVKNIQYPITDADGDSLVYALVQPLDAWSSTNGTEPGQGAYPYYPGLNWAGGFNLSNIVGGNPPMSIDPTTGVITAAPAQQAFFTFAVRVEEYRNGVKIGETRRDLQYYSFNCQGNALPNLIPHFNATNTLPFVQNDTTCWDFVLDDPNGTDTVYISITSDLYNNGGPGGDGYYTMSPTNNYGVWNPTTQVYDSMLINQTLAPYPNTYQGIGNVGMRVCWKPDCTDDLDSLYSILIETYSFGCDGIDTGSFQFWADPYPNTLTPPNYYGEISGLEVNRDITVLEEFCIDIAAYDAEGDTSYLYVSSNTFLEGAEYSFTPNNTYYYTDTATGQEQSIVINNQTIMSSSSISVQLKGDGKVGLRYCWTPQCENVMDDEYYLRVVGWNVTQCGDSISSIDKYINLDVKPYPYDTLENVPNVFTPNGDGVNDEFRISGIYDPCLDAVEISIYNRWGILVYESTDIDFAWDGKNKAGNDCPAGTYFIMLKGKYAEQTVDRNHTITLLR
ncbi:MAG: hypothetical protein Kow0079_01390 [Vicingaceae bacterium]